MPTENLQPNGQSIMYIPLAHYYIVSIFRVYTQELQISTHFLLESVPYIIKIPSVNILMYYSYYTSNCTNHETPMIA